MLGMSALPLWALDESGAPIDATGVMPDGTKFNGPDQLKRALLGSDRFITTLTEKLMTFALGRGVEHTDMPVIRSIVRDAAKDDNRFSAIVLGIIKSAQFQMRTKTAAESAN